MGRWVDDHHRFGASGARPLWTRVRPPSRPGGVLDASVPVDDLGEPCLDGDEVLEGVDVLLAARIPAAQEVPEIALRASAPIVSEQKTAFRIAFITSRLPACT